MIQMKLSSADKREHFAAALFEELGLREGELAGALMLLLDRADAALAIKDAATGRYVHASTRYAELFGHTPEDMIGHADAELMEPADANSMRAGEQTAMTQTLPTVSEQRLERDGQRREFAVTRVTLGRSGAAAARFVCAMWIELTQARRRDSQLNLAIAQLEQQQLANEALRREVQDDTVHDPATGVYQASTFADQLRREVDLSARESRQFSLVSIALDPPNEAVRDLGGRARDRVLEALGSLIRGNTRAMDSSCRLGDDRFAVLLSGVGLATAHSRMEGLRRQCATQIVVLDGHDLGFTVSMGVASFPHTASSREDLLLASDAALAEARRRGGNHVSLAGIRFDSAGG
jgi:diguanylate cyclase (GGDEF)-like protein/PAS domain S-box-containing protein